MSGCSHHRRRTPGQDVTEGDERSLASTERVGGKRRRTPQTPLQRALALLTRREHSRRELIRKLQERGVGAAEAEAVVEQLAEQGWQDDRRYAELVVRSRVSGGYGPRRIRAELSQQGLEADLIADAMQTFDGDWTETACDLVRRRFGPAGLETMAQRSKAADLLLRRGFEGDSIRRASRFEAED